MRKGERDGGTVTSCRMTVSMREEAWWKAPMLRGSSCAHIS